MAVRVRQRGTHSGLSLRHEHQHAVQQCLQLRLHAPLRHHEQAVGEVGGETGHLQLRLLAVTVPARAWATGSGWTGGAGGEEG
jgi:hypothetical protein